MADREYPLSLIIRAVDRATAPLRQINQRIQQFTAPVRRLNNSFRALADEAGLPRLMKGFAGVGRAVTNVGREALSLGLKISAMAAGAGYALYRIVRGAVDAGDKLGEMAQRVGLSVDAYAQLQFAAAQADVEQEAFNSAMDQFNKRLGMAKAGGGELLTFLQKVSPTLAQQVKGAKSTEEALGLMTSAFERVADPGKRAALAAAAFGRSGLQMGQFLGQGSKAIEEQRRRFFELSGSQEAFARGASELDNSMRETEMAFLGLRNAAAGALFPAFTELSRAVSTFLVQNREGIAKWATEAGAAISEWVRGGELKQLVADLRSIAGVVGTVVRAIGGLKGMAAIVGVVLGSKLAMSVLGLASALWKLGGAALPVVARAGAALAPMLAGAASALAGLLAVAWPFVAAAGAIGAAGYAIYKAWEPLKELFSQPLEAIKAINEMILFPLEALKTAGSWWKKEIFGPDSTARPTLGADRDTLGASPKDSEAHVTVDFNNLPPGARVTQDPKSTAQLDLSMGYSMIGAP